MKITASKLKHIALTAQKNNRRKSILGLYRALKKTIIIHAKHGDKIAEFKNQNDSVRAENALIAMRLFAYKHRDCKVLFTKDDDDSYFIQFFII